MPSLIPNNGYPKRNNIRSAYEHINGVLEVRARADSKYDVMQRYIHVRGLGRRGRKIVFSFS